MSNYAPLSDVVSKFATPYQNISYVVENSKTSVIPVINNTSIRNDLNTDRPNSVTSVNLPQGVLLKNSVLVLKIAKENLKKFMYLQKGWGYAAIRNMTFQVSGSSNRLEMTNLAMLIKNIADCESGAKINTLMDLAGEEFDGAGDATKDYYAYINLYCPWGSVSSKRWIPYDAHLMRQPAVLRIELNKFEDFINIAGGNYGGLTPAETAPILPVAWAESYVLTKTQILREPSPLPMIYGVGTTGEYNYPYMFPQDEIQSLKVSNVDAANNVIQSVDLKGFRSGNLQSIDLFLERVTFDENQSMSLASVNPSLLAYAPRDVRLMYGGQELYRSDDNSAQIMNLFDNENNMRWETAAPSTYVPTGVTSSGSVPVVSATTGRKSEYVHIQLSQLNETVFCDLIQQGLEMVSQDVKLFFTVPNAGELSPPNNNAGGSVTYRVHTVYNYLASVRTVAGNTELAFKSIRSLIQ